MNIHSRLGQTATPRTVNLIKGKASDGSSRVYLDRDADLTVSKGDEAIVIHRQDAAGVWNWTPATTTAEVGDYFEASAGSPSQGDSIGTWDDGKGWFNRADGKVQQKEVRQFSEAWSQETFENTTTEYSSQYQQDYAWFSSYSTVVPGAPEVTSKQMATGTVVTLTEPTVVSRIKAKSVDVWARRGSGRFASWGPYSYNVAEKCL